MNQAILLISCRDQKGITAAVTNFVYEKGGNILHADQHIDEQKNVFFMRIQWDLTDFQVSRDQIAGEFKEIASKYDMDWALSFCDQKPRVAIFVTHRLHCLYDLLFRYKSGELECEIPLVISNHEEARSIVESFGIDYHVFPITPENKIEQEKKEIELLKKENIDLIVLARYHQILTDQMIKEFPNKIINIHHSFLPAFAGSNPYGQAYSKGVKIVGATSHYVIEDLDQGPIIEQDTVRVSHSDSLKNLVYKGQDLEKIVLSRAVRWHLQRRILCYDNKTVIFD